ncbi:MAG: hypothetical protein HEEMFOPI_00209 [Holosporales bacterium]
MSLQIKLQQKIEKIGEIPVDQYINDCLFDQEFGYYKTRHVLGREGDFITSPEITQIFGELIAVFIIQEWQRFKGCPVQIIEYGPGRGVLMQDMLRVFSKFPDFMDSLKIHLIECSSSLKIEQAQRLKNNKFVFWHESFDTIPLNDSFTFVLANEFFDALPIKQSILKNEQRIERKIILNEKGQFCFNGNNLVEETHEYYKSMITPINERAKVASFLGFLIIDYGYFDEDVKGDTLQGMQDNFFSSILENPGMVDISHHVNFNTIVDCLDFIFTNIIFSTQKEFLEMLGIEERLNQLLKKANPNQRMELLSSCTRLISPSHMGELFKVLYASTHD